MPNPDSTFCQQIISDSDDTGFEMVNPDFLPRVRMGCDHIVDVDAALKTHEPIPETGTDDDGPSLCIPILGCDSICLTLAGDVDESLCNAAFHPWLVSTYEDDEVHGSISRHKVKCSTDRRRLAFIPARIDDDRRRSKVSSLSNLLTVVPENDNDVVDRPSSNIGDDRLKHRVSMNIDEILRAFEPFTRISGNYNSDNGHAARLQPSAISHQPESDPGQRVFRTICDRLDLRLRSRIAIQDAEQFALHISEPRDHSQ